MEQYAGLGISGERKIPVSQAVSQEYRLRMVIRLYVDERIKKIEEHNKKVLEQVSEKSNQRTGSGHLP